MRHPVPVLVGTLFVVLLFAWPVLHIETGDPGGDGAPAALRGAAGLRHPAVALRRLGAVADLRPATWDGGSGALAPANLQRLFEYGRRLQALPGVARVTSVVNLPGVETPEAAAGFWRAVHGPPAPAAARDGAGLPGLLQGLLGAQQRAAALRLRELDHGSRHGALPGRPQGAPRLRGGAGSRRDASTRPPPEGTTRPRRRCLHDRPRLRAHPVPALSLDHPVRGLRHAVVLLAAPAQRRPAAQSGAHEHPVPARRLRRHGVDLPGRPSASGSSTSRAAGPSTPSCR